MKGSPTGAIIITKFEFYQVLVYLLLRKTLFSVQQILHVEPHVFVSLHNGALVVFNRDKQGLWDMDNYQIIVIDTTGALNTVF